MICFSYQPSKEKEINTVNQRKFQKTNHYKVPKEFEIQDSRVIRVMEDKKLYHEKQKYFFCAKHTLNNLYQDKLFSSKLLDTICEQLTKTKYLIYNPHRNLFKLGNYDINVIEKAIQQHGHTIQWFDMRKNVREINFLQDKDNIFGLILNVQYKNTLDKIMGCNTHHWLAIKLVDNCIVNLDSKKEQPEALTEDELYQYLERVQKDNGQILVVRPIQYDQEEIEIIKEENQKEREDGFRKEEQIQYDVSHQ